MKKPAIGRTLLVATVKNEGPNILEWVSHHLLAGFDDIVVYQNDSIDGTDDTLRLLAELRIPERSGQRFRKYPATHSDFIRPLIPEYPATL
ncbi:glycosyltransferase family 2 protein [Pseudogemmobacter sp. W21_MBD1_M6]|uniref:glycosyltransferase family 2 protein n=1 Tax=Pseudogemmobacter sp. W21_MBD1_M6 TaxID=3240271 RepID=UPI003F9C38D1